ncbi:MAG TPA: PQQ-dependent sugar dehydrogenase [Candidatus Eisenbacteria bacterium]
MKVSHRGILGLAAAIALGLLAGSTIPAVMAVAGNDKNRHDDEKKNDNRKDKDKDDDDDDDDDRNGPGSLRDVVLPGGYKIREFAGGLNFPTGITWDSKGNVFVSEAGIADTPARIVRIDEDADVVPVANGFTAPVTDVTWHDGWLYVSHLGTISRIRPDGSGREDVVTGLPAFGDHSNADIIFGPDGRMYFSIGTATNSGVVGPDNSWVMDHPEVHDIPAETITVRAENYTSPNIMTSTPNDVTLTGPFQPFGEAAALGEVVPGEVKSNGSILSANPDGSDLQVYAWGFRNAFGLGFDESGQLWATNNGMDERGSRPIEGDLDAFFQVEQGDWYGWPDFSLGRPVNQELFEVDGVIPELLLLSHPPLSPLADAFAVFEDHVSADKFDFSSSSRFRYEGDAFVAETGSLPTLTGAADYYGYRVTRVDHRTGDVSVFLANKSGKPAFVTGEDGINKPIDVKFAPDNADVMFVVDFGAFLPTPATEEEFPSVIEPGSGTIWVVGRASTLNEFARNQGDDDEDDDGDDGEEEIDGAPGTGLLLNTSVTAGPTINYRLESPQIVSLRVFDVTGRVVRTLVEEPQVAGDHVVAWDGQDDQFAAVPSGVYFYRIEAGADRQSGKVLITAP